MEVFCLFVGLGVLFGFRGFFLSFDHIVYSCGAQVAQHALTIFVGGLNSEKVFKITDQETMHTLTVMLSSFSLLETSVEVI